jgi:hypothetical protein
VFAPVSCSQSSRRVRKIREPRLAHAQQQLCQTSRTTSSPILSPTALWPGRGIEVAFPQRVEREDLLRDHCDGGQRHAQAGHEADKVLLLELVRRGRGVGVPESSLRPWQDIFSREATQNNEVKSENTADAHVPSSLRVSSAPERSLWIKITQRSQVPKLHYACHT